MKKEIINDFCIIAHFHGHYWQLLTTRISLLLDLFEMFWVGRCGGLLMWRMVGLEKGVGWL